MRKIKKLTAWISRKIKKLAILTCICGFLQYFLAKIKKLAHYFSAKIKKLTGWIFDKFIIKKTVCININKIFPVAVPPEPNNARPGYLMLGYVSSNVW